MSVFTSCARGDKMKASHTSLKLAFPVVILNDPLPAVALVKENRSRNKKKDEIYSSKRSQSSTVDQTNLSVYHLQN